MKNAQFHRYPLANPNIESSTSYIQFESSCACSRDQHDLLNALLN